MFLTRVVKCAHTVEKKKHIFFTSPAPDWHPRKSEQRATDSIKIYDDDEIYLLVIWDSMVLVVRDTNEEYSKLLTFMRTKHPPPPSSWVSRIEVGDSVTRTINIKRKRRTTKTQSNTCSHTAHVPNSTSTIVSYHSGTCFVSFSQIGSYHHSSVHTHNYLYGGDRMDELFGKGQAPENDCELVCVSHAIDMCLLVRLLDRRKYLNCSEHYVLTDLSIAPALIQWQRPSPPPWTIPSSSTRMRIVKQHPSRGKRRRRKRKKFQD